MSQVITSLRDSIDSVKSEVIEWRRYFHKYPELSFKEEKTSQFVFERLQTVENLEISRPTKTSVMARLIGRKPGKIIAMRADMDALPIHEENDLPFASRNDGVMHACGHDGHTAMLLGAAKVLAQYKDSINGEIRFIFQHAEELQPGGAREMVKAGVLEGVDQVIGIHLWSPMPVGKIGICYGSATAASDMLDIVIQGKGGHSAKPQETVDPIAIGSQIVSNLQHIVSRNIDPLDSIVISLTKFNGGDAYNVIPDTVSLGGSIRTLNQNIRKKLPDLIEQVVKGIAEAHGAAYKANVTFGYGSVINDETVTKAVEETIVDVFGKETLIKMPPEMVSEDFSAYSNEKPASFIFVGAGNEEKGIVYPHHHPRFTIDEAALNHGVTLFVNAALKLLGEN
ncbi:M20 family metallopeptidase [Scopulibacillus cellulosilyticus]|uniref:M20 family metallopeptidase n=1 Tax=Scopulibacillus cellulosilyticus TaxID=2665665 RepID=A0ABW2PUV3_9BACL